MDLSKYRALRCGQRLIANRVIICDEPLSGVNREKIHNLRTLDDTGFTLLEGHKLCETLEVLLEEALQGAQNALIVFPGDGAQYPRSRSKFLREFPCVDVSAGRFWSPGSDPIAVAGTILPEIFLHLHLELIVVVDDVISSGATMLALHKRNAWRFPKARWVAATWVLQRPQSRALSGLVGYDMVLGGYVVSKPDGSRSAVNSLSTLRNDPMLARSYAERHLVDGDREKFIQCL